MKRKSSVLTAVFFAFTVAVASAQLTEESVRELLLQRDELIRQKRFEEAGQLYTPDAMITTCYRPYATEDAKDPNTYYRKFADSEWRLYSSTTIVERIEISADGKSARTEGKAEYLTCPENKRKRTLSWHLDESLQIILTHNVAKIGSDRLYHERYSWKPDELYNRIMTRINKGERIDKETAIAWLKEADYSYSETNGKGMIAPYSCDAIFISGDEIPALAAQIPEVCVFRPDLVSDAGMVYISQMKNLERLQLTFAEVSDAGVAELTACTNLNALVLNSPHITDQALQHIAAIPKLQELNITLTPNAGAGLVHLAHAAELKKLTIHHASSEDLHFLTAIPSLDNLTISGDSICDDDLIRFENMKTLNTLHLYGTTVTPAGAKQLHEKRPDLFIRLMGSGEFLLLPPVNDQTR